MLNGAWLPVWHVTQMPLRIGWMSSSKLTSLSTVSSVVFVSELPAASRARTTKKSCVADGTVSVACVTPVTVIVGVP